MKITESELRKIIREHWFLKHHERQSSMQSQASKEDALLALEQAAEACLKLRCDPEEMKEILKDVLSTSPSFDQQLGLE